MANYLWGETMPTTYSITRRSILGGLGSAAVFPRALLALQTTASTNTTNASMVVHARGARVPTGLSNRIKAQNSSAALVSHTLGADQAFLKAFEVANPRTFVAPNALPAQFDWRQSNRVTPIKNQGQCGSCWAFAAVAAYESAYLIANKIDAIQNGGSALNVSEQEALDCAFVEDDCVLGGWHEVVFLYLQLQGEVSGTTYGYHGAKGFCTSNLSSRPYYALNWGYVADATPASSLLPSDAAIKQAIYRYGPVASSVATKGWDSYSKTYANWSKDFPNGIFAGEPTSKLKVTDIDHEVAIVGWDDNLGVWLIKNSWDTDWGDGGYMKLKYQSNYIGFGSSWVLVSPSGSVSTSLQNSVKAVNGQNALMKFYPKLKIFN